MGKAIQSGLALHTAVAPENLNGPIRIQQAGKLYCPESNVS